MTNQEARQWFENRLQSATMPAAREAFKAAVEAFEELEQKLDGKIVITVSSSCVTIDGPECSHWIPMPESTKETDNE